MSRGPRLLAYSLWREMHSGNDAYFFFVIVPSRSSKCAAMMPVVHHAAHKQGSRRSLIVRAETEDIDLEMDLGEKTRPDTGEDIDVDMDYGYDDGKISFEDIVVGENYVARVVSPAE